MSVAITSLSPYLTENLESKARRLSYGSIAYSVLEKITWVAIAAIFGGLLAISFTGAILSGSASLVVLVAIVATYPLMELTIYARNRSDELRKEAAMEKRVIVQLKRMKQWKENEVLQFLQGDGVPPEQLDPLIQPKALLPLIVRYAITKLDAQQLRKEADKAARDQNKDRAVRLIQREHGLERLEWEAVPKMIDAAILLQIIQQPTLQFKIAQSNPTLSYSKLGKCRPKLPLARILDRKIPPIDDLYFFFVKSLKKKPLTLQEMVDARSPNDLRLKLFGG